MKHYQNQLVGKFSAGCAGGLLLSAGCAINATQIHDVDGQNCLFSSFEAGERSCL